MSHAQPLLTKKRILVAATHFVPHTGGVEHYTRDFFGALKKQYPNTEITIVALDQLGAPSRASLAGLEVVRIPAFGWDINPFFSPSSVRRTLESLGAETYDVVITQCRYYFFTYWMNSWAREKGMRRVHIEHNAGYMSHSNRMIALVAWCYERSVGALLLKHTENIVAISDSVRIFLEQSFRVKAVVLYGGVDTTLWKPPHVDENQSEKITFVFCGRFIREKGIYTLLQAFFTLSKKRTDIELVFIGSGPEELSLRERVKQLRLSTSVSVLGRKSADEIRALYAKRPIFVNPSTYPEGLQMALLEAASSELPIITTSVGGATELLEDGVSALFVNTGNEALVSALERLVLDGSLRMQLGREARKSVERKCDVVISTRRFYEYVFQTIHSV